MGLKLSGGAGRLFLTNAEGELIIVKPGMESATAESFDTQREMPSNYGCPTGTPQCSEYGIFYTFQGG